MHGERKLEPMQQKERGQRHGGGRPCKGGKQYRRDIPLQTLLGQASWELLESQPPINNEIIESITKSSNA
jgi:hypothetical protein